MKKQLLTLALTTLCLTTLYSQTFKEVEPNNSFAEANLVTAPVVITDSMGIANDVDFFKVDLESSGVLTITLADLPVDQKIRLYAYNSAQSQIAFIQSPSDGSGFTYDFLLPAGISYFKVLDYNGKASTHAFHLDLSLDTSDGCECNNDFATACLVSPDGTVHPQLFGFNSDLGGNDVDFFKLDLPVCGVVTLNLSNLGLEQRIRLYTYNSSQSQIAFKESPSHGTGFSIDLLLPAGISYFKIYDYNNNSDSTHLNLLLTYDITDQCELNNSFASACLVSASDTLFPQLFGFNSDLGGNDVDFYEIQTGNCFNQCFNISDVQAGQRLRLHIYDDQQKQIGFAESPSAGTGFNYCLDLGIGKYYLKFYDYNGTSSSGHVTMILSNLFSMTAPVITLVDSTLQSSEGAFYQWYLDQEIIEGATTQTITPEHSGYYTVMATSLIGCSNISEPYYFLKVGIDDIHIENSISIFPNPANGKFTIVFPESSSQILIFNSYGQLIQAQILNGHDSLEVEVTGKGVFFVKIYNDNIISTRRIIVF